MHDRLVRATFTATMCLVGAVSLLLTLLPARPLPRLSADVSPASASPPVLPTERAESQTPPAEVARILTEDPPPRRSISGNNTVEPGGGTAAEVVWASGCPLRYVARAVESSGAVLFVFKDIATERVLPLARGGSRGGWQLVDCAGEEFVLRQGDASYRISRP